MRSLSVHPQPPTHPTTTTAPVDWHVVYEITASDELPLVNATRSVRSVWLRGRYEEAYVRFMNRFKLSLISGYAIGLMACWVVLLAPARTGGWIAAIATTLTSLMGVVYSLVLRYDVVWLVVRTYEFWFFSISNLLSAVLLGLHLGGLRASMAFAIWLMLQNNIFTDANTVFTRGYVAAAMGVLLFLITLTTMVMLGLIDDTYEFELIRLDENRRLLVQDALVHGYSTQAIMLARNIYRRWITPTRPRTTHNGVATMHCVTLRARLTLRRIDEGALHAPLSRGESKLHQNDGSTLVRLKLVPVAARFPVANTTISAVGGVLFTANSFKRNAVRMVLATLAYTGLSLTAVDALLPNGAYTKGIRLVSFACSALFIASLMTVTQPELLRRLVSTFDFAFLSFQLFAVHACLCDMVGWGYDSLPFVTSWLWIQWVIAMDAVAPLVKTRWGIRRQLPSIIMLVFIVSQILVFVAIVLDDSTRLRNRILVSVRIHGHLIEMRVIPMLLSRLVLLFSWSWKVLWRMWTMRPGELLMIQGTMTYANVHRSRKPRIGNAVDNVAEPCRRPSATPIQSN